MNIWVEQLSKKEWKPLSERAHLVAFGELKPESVDRIDFAVVARNTEGLMGYITCREFDANTLYWQYGCAFPGTKDTVHTSEMYRKAIEFFIGKYHLITTLIENKNVAMLKMAMRHGFRIVGCRFVEGKIFLEHHLELP